jgi:hypothetical protein
MGEIRNAFDILAGKPEGKSLVRRLRHRWEDNIRINLWEIGWEGMFFWIHLAQVRDQWQALVNMVMNVWVS